MHKKDVSYFKGGKMEAVFKIDSNNAGIVLCECTDRYGAEIRKKITVEDFVKIIQSNGEDIAGLYDETLYCNPPKGCRNLKGIDGLYLGKRENSKTFSAVFFIPGHKNVLNYHGKNYTIPYPPLIFYFEVVRGILSETLVYATKCVSMDDLDSDTQLYRFPFGNVSESGEVCWGSVEFPILNRYEDLRPVIYQYFGSEVNDDYYRIDVSVKGRDEFHLQRGLLEDLQDWDSFPEEYLVESRNRKFSLLEQRFAVN